MVSCTLRKYLLGKSHLGAQILNMAPPRIELGNTRCKRVSLPLAYGAVRYKEKICF